MTSDAVSRDKSDQSDEGRQLSPEQAAAAAMVAEARQRGLELTGPDGLLKLFTKNVLETALNEEIPGTWGMRRTRLSRDASPRMCATAPAPRRSSPMRWARSASMFPATGKELSSRRS